MCIRDSANVMYRRSFAAKHGIRYDEELKAVSYTHLLKSVKI